jgi:hypothetical protein
MSNTQPYRIACKTFLACDPTSTIILSIVPRVLSQRKGSTMSNQSLSAISFVVLVMAATTPASVAQVDQDGDGIIDSLDNCPTISNFDQINEDTDSLGDVCDNCLAISNDDQAYSVPVPGDANADGLVNVADIIFILTYIWKSGPEPLPCRAAADVNCSGFVSSGDILELVIYIFKSGTPPCDVCNASGLNWSCP